MKIPKNISNVYGEKRIWHYHVNKKPKMPKGYTDPDHKCWLTLADAEVKVRELQAKNPAIKCGLVLNLKATQLKIGDLDVDGETQELRPSQLKLIEQYKGKTLIIRSSSGKGAHIYWNDTADALDKIASARVVDGTAPCEIKSELIFIPLDAEIISDCPIAIADDHIKNICKEVTNKVNGKKNDKKNDKQASSKKGSKKASTKKPSKSKMRDFANEFVQSFRASGKPLCPTNSDFERVVCILATCGLTEEEIILICSEEDGFDSTAPDRIRSFAEKVAGEEAQISSAVAYAKDRGVQIGLPTGSIVVPPKYAPPHAYAYCMQKLGVEMRNNELAIVPAEMKLPQTNEWCPYNDANANRLYLDYIQPKCFVKTDKGVYKQRSFSKEVRFDVPRHLATKAPYNEIASYFKGIKAAKCNPAVLHWLTAYKIDNNKTLEDRGKSARKIAEYYLAGILSLGAGIYRRTLNPGCLHDIFIVFSAPQGAGKGLGLKLLLPPQSVEEGLVVANNAIRTQLKFQKDMNNEIIKLQTCVLAEFQELIGHNRIDTEAFKAFVSEDTDLLRRAYDRELSVYPRKCVIVGTTNEHCFKPLDASGDRRTFPMAIDSRLRSRSEVSVQLPQIFNDEWRKAWWGHVKWLVEEHGYIGLEKDWSNNVRECRDIMVNATTKEYPEIVTALNKLAYNRFSGEIHTEEYNRQIPFNPKNLEPGTTTLITLLNEDCPEIVRKYRPEVIRSVAVDQMGWGWKKFRRYSPKKVYRGWITFPLPERPRKPLLNQEVVVDGALEESVALAKVKQEDDKMYALQKQQNREDELRKNTEDTQPSPTTD